MTTLRHASGSILSRPGALVAMALGLLLVLGATLGPAPLPGSDPGRSLAVRLPDLVRVGALTLLALSALILLALQRPRRRSGEEMTLVRARRRPAAWVVAVLGPPLLLCVAAYLLWTRWSGAEDNPVERAFTAMAQLLDLIAGARKPPASVPFFDFAIAGLVALAALAIFLLMLLLLLAERLDRWLAHPGAAVAPTGAVAAPAAPADPRAELDPRLAVLRAWDRFERALSAARSPRAAWQTPAECARTALARLPLPAPPVQRLTALLEVARFSDRRLDAGAREAACDCLEAIEAALAEDRHDAP